MVIEPPSTPMRFLSLPGPARSVPGYELQDTHLRYRVTTTLGGGFFRWARSDSNTRKLIRPRGQQVPMGDGQTANQPTLERPTLTNCLWNVCGTPERLVLSVLPSANSPVPTLTQTTYGRRFNSAGAFQ